MKQAWKATRAKESCIPFGWDSISGSDGVYYLTLLESEREDERWRKNNGPNEKGIPIAYISILPYSAGLPSLS
jgi:hypothetical protein